jgi:hypothetical protein
VLSGSRINTASRSDALNKTRISDTPVRTNAHANRDEDHRSSF